MNEVTDQESQVAYYMSHRGVFRTEKATTKLRIVSNASNPTTNGKSLNSNQDNGGMVKEELFPIIFRGACEDVSVGSSYLRNGECALSGNSNFNKLSIDEEDNFPLAAPVLRNVCYVDDTLSGAETKEDVIELQHQLIALFKTAKMKLHKWCGTIPELTSSLQEDHDFSESDETNALGIIWYSRSICLLFSVKLKITDHFTKQKILSTIAGIFDPLGLLGPIVT
ncbi:hypothetical protein AVEN_153493-1 [Araneus ventricosus]|uniref:Reverse transcriptase domain-containing protein n=1 Tax=Araneus ventricosus TaxID=182803 RepID=A0A4Y2K6J7_ARAVE|nr:hypothetical protein AVEN_153493-1 [Araneus ventricosus]